MTATELSYDYLKYCKFSQLSNVQIYSVITKPQQKLTIQDALMKKIQIQIF